jgi:hypothetical protein
VGAAVIERDVKNKVKRIIAKYEQQGHVFWSYWPVQTGFGKHGIPDCLVCINGYLLAIECKVDCKDPTTRQWYELLEIERSRGTTLVIDQHNLQEVERVIEALVRGDHIAALRISEGNVTTYPVHV